jgi:predicted O-methyltransferase YrrM
VTLTDCSLKLIRLRQEIWNSSYYRLRPLRTARLLKAKYRLARSRTQDSTVLLHSLGIDPLDTMHDFNKWRSLFESTVDAVRTKPGDHGGISLEDGFVLYTVARSLRPQHVIETGVAAGVSTTFLGAALIDNGSGQLCSIELPAENVRGQRQADGALFQWPDYGVGWAIPDTVRAQLGQRHRLVLQDVRAALPSILSKMPSVDLFFHDDLHQPDHMLWEYRLVWEHLNPGGLLISDDVNYGWVRFCEEQNLPESALSNVQRLAAVRKRVNSLNV